MEKRRPIVPWAVGLLLALTIYPLSFGPVCWLQSRHLFGTDNELVSTFYQPILAATADAPAPLQKAVLWYAGLGARRFYEPVMVRYGRPFPGRLVSRKVQLIWSWSGPYLH